MFDKLCEKSRERFRVITCFECCNLLVELVTFRNVKIKFKVAVVVQVS